jgi:hypothetical protein
MFVSLTETVAAAILLIILAIFILHLINGDAMQWLASKFTVAGDTTTTSGGTSSTGGGGSGGAIA